HFYRCTGNNHHGSNANPICPELVLLGHNEMATMRHHLIVHQCVPGNLESECTEELSSHERTYNYSLGRLVTSRSSLMFDDDRHAELPRPRLNAPSVSSSVLSSSARQSSSFFSFADRPNLAASAPPSPSLRGRRRLQTSSSSTRSSPASSSSKQRRSLLLPETDVSLKQFFIPRPRLSSDV
ncbi:unnamed protein product, partial [Nesidiocoris tenuis]